VDGWGGAGGIELRCFRVYWSNMRVANTLFNPNPDQTAPTSSKKRHQSTRITTPTKKALTAFRCRCRTPWRSQCCPRHRHRRPRARAPRRQSVCQQTRPGRSGGQTQTHGRARPAASALPAGSRPGGSVSSRRSDRRWEGRRTVRIGRSSTAARLPVVVCGCWLLCWCVRWCVADWGWKVVTTRGKTEVGGAWTRQVTFRSPTWQPQTN